MGVCVINISQQVCVKMSDMTDVLGGLIDLVSSVPPIWRNLIAGFFIMLETSVFVGLIIPGDTVVLVASTGVTDLLDAFFLLTSDAFSAPNFE